MPEQPTPEERLTALETEMPHIYADLAYIKKQVSNDLPHQIEAVQTTVNLLSRKMGDMDAISRFLTVLIKGIAILMTVVWSTIQIVKSLLALGR